MRTHFVRPVLAALALASLATAGVAHSTPHATAAEGDVVLAENFDSGALPKGFTPVAGSWKIVDGKLVVDGGAISRITFGPHLANYRMEADVTFTKVANATRWAGFLIDAPATGKTPWWQSVIRTTSTAANGAEVAQRTAADTWNVPFTGSASADAAVGRTVHLVAEVRGGKVSWFFDGKKVVEGRIGRSSEGVLGFVADGSTVTYDNLKVTELAAEPAVGGAGEPATVIAHRGYSQVNPENSLASAVAGERAGARYIETDVQTTKDGVPVIMHDNSVDRTTTASGDISTKTAAEMAGLEIGSWFHPAFAAQRTPTLAEFLTTVKAGSADLLLEVKGPETDDQVRHILDVIREHGMLDRTIVQSFDEGVLKAAKAYVPEVRTGLLRGALDPDPLAKAKELGVMSYNPSFGTLKARPEVVEKLNAAGIAVYAWTADSHTDWKWLTEAGVDGIITNRPGALVGWQSAQTQLPAPQPPAAPTVTIVSPGRNARVERGDDVVIAVTGTAVDKMVITLDGRRVAQGSVLSASELSLGKHTVTVTGTGAGGQASASTTFRVVVTAEGVAQRLVTLDVSNGQRQQMLTALDQRDYRRLDKLVAKFVVDAEDRDRLREEIATLG